MAAFARLRDLTSRWRGATAPVAPVASQPAPEPFQGEVQSVSATHVEGWARSVADPGRRVPFRAVLPATGEVLAEATADQFLHGLHGAGGGDGAHGFVVKLRRTLNEAEREALEVRPLSGDALPRSAYLRATFEPILHVAMDIVDNCNLRCPFCLYDYANVRATHFMTEPTIEAALRLLPYVRDGEFFFSCLHEPTLHPKLTQYIDKVPREYRRKLFYTTNVAKRMPAAYYEWLADSGMHHINISIESREPALYERMRKGARYHIFMENWDHLLRAYDQGGDRPRLRYISMVYKSNLRELPDLVCYLLEERRAAQVELRYTFDVPHLPEGFREAEFLDRKEWLWLRDQLAGYPPDKVLLLMPPEAPPGTADAAVIAEADTDGQPAPAPAGFLPYRYLFRMSWDGSVRVVGVQSDSRFDDARERLVTETNVQDIADPHSYLEQLAALCEPPEARLTVR